MPVSPGIYPREFDFSAYAQKLGLTSLAIVGAASKGPVNKPMFFTNEADFVAAFGKPLLDEYGVQSAIQFLKEGDQLTFVRVANAAATASYPLPGLSGGTPAVKASGSIVFVGNNNPTDGETVTIAATVATADLQADVIGLVGNQPIVVTQAVANTIKVPGNSLSGGTASSRAIGKIKLAGVPTDGDTVSISDGAVTTVFEFDDDASVTGANVAVAIVAGDPYATLTNLVAAINGNAVGVSAADNVVKVDFEFDNNGAYTVGSRPVLIGATALDTMVNLISAISVSGLPFDVSNTTVTVPQATLVAKVAGADANAVIFEGGANITVTGLTGGADAVAGSTMTVAHIRATSPGAWGNGLKVQITAPSVIIGAPTGNFDLIVEAPFEDGTGTQVVERFTNLSLSVASDRFITAILTSGKRGEVGPSAYIAVEVLSGAGTPASGTYTLGQSPGVAGTNGVDGLTASDYIGTVSGQVATGLRALRNPETTEFNLLAVPGVTHAQVIAAMLDLCKSRGDALALIDAPFGLTTDQVIDWHNGLSTIVPDAPTGPLDNNYGALYWSWVEVNDGYNAKTVWLPPSGQVAAAMAYSDRVAGPWFAAAGDIRGLVNGNRVEYSPLFEDRERLLGDPNRVNPIISRSTGLVVWGNRTLQRRLTALNSVHIRRMMLYVQKASVTAVQYLVFDPNDSQTWDAFKLKVEGVLSRVKAARGIEDYQVICDATTNPPEQRQRKTMRGKIRIKPVEAAEIILMDFALFATGGEFNTNF